MDLANIEYYNYKQKYYYANKYPKKAKNLMSVLTIFMFITKDSKKTIIISDKNLKWVICIYYFIVFKVESVLNPIPSLINSSNKVNTLYLTFAKKLGLIVQLMNVKVYKIDTTIFQTLQNGNSSVFNN